MAEKWSAQPEKESIVDDDEFLIIDSEDGNDATKSKRDPDRRFARRGRHVKVVGDPDRSEAHAFGGVHDLEQRVEILAEHLLNAESHRRLLSA